jgi:hypothetical protein
MTVEKCGLGCPFRDQGDEFYPSYCNAANAEAPRSGSPPPEWCPLRRGPVTVKLKPTT